MHVIMILSYICQFSKYVSKEGARLEICSHKNTLLSKGVGDETPLFPMWHVLSKFGRGNQIYVNVRK